MVFSETLQAFNRTTAHPLDKGVRLTTALEDVIAFQCSGVKAVIVKRPLPLAIDAEMRREFNWRSREGITAYQAPLIQVSRNDVQWTTANLPEHSLIRFCPSLLADAVMLSDTFRYALGAEFFNTRDRLFFYGIDYPACESEIDFRDQQTMENEVATLPFLPLHHDRIYCSYSNAPKTGIGWFPGSYTVCAHDRIRHEYLSSNNPDRILKKYLYQTTEPGDIILLRGTSPWQSTEGVLLYKFPRPRDGVPIISAMAQRQTSILAHAHARHGASSKIL